MRNSISRRMFLKGAGMTVLAGAAGAGLAACSPAEESASADEVTQAQSNAVETTAGGDWLGEAPDITEADITEQVDTEVLVVGAATAGSFAAYGAVKGGAKVTVIDKHTTFHYGGNGMSFINSKFQLGEGIPEFDKTDILFDLVNNTQCRADASLISLWVNNSGDLCDTIIEDIAEPYGLEYYIKEQPQHDFRELNPSSNTCVGFGNPDADNIKEFLTAVHQYIEDNGGEFVYNVRAQKLVQDEDGTVTGVIATDADGNYVQYNASKGVIMCTGAYGSNTDMVETFVSPKTRKFIDDNGGTMYMGYMEPEEMSDEPLDVGDGHKLMCWAGAVMEDSTQPVNGWTTAGIWSAPYLAVSQISGRRFFNEALSPTNQIQTVVELPYDELPFYYHIMSNEPETMPTVMDIPADAYDFFLSIAQIEEADTLEELAEKMGVDKDNFLATVERYNEMCHNGYDEDYGKSKAYLIPVETPPFQALRVTMGVAVTLGGVICDNTLNVLNDKGLRIPHLYAAGNTVGRRLGWAYEGQHIGITNSLAMAHGFAAGQNAAAN